MGLHGPRDEPDAILKGGVRLADGRLLGSEIWALNGLYGSLSGEELWEKRILSVTWETKRYRPLWGIGRQQSSVGQLL